MDGERGWGRRVLRHLVESLDLWLLVAAAMVFTVLGVTGIAGQALLSSAVLALLAFLAVSQFRSRQQVDQIAQAQRSRPTDLLTDGPPEDLFARRNAAQDVLLIGSTLSSTIPTYLRGLRSALHRGATVRVMVTDPELLHQLSLAPPNALPHRTSSRRRRAENTLAELVEEQRRAVGVGNLEIRVASFDPTLRVDAIDARSGQGLLVLAHHEFEPLRHGSPFVTLRPEDGYWYRHFLEEAERMWAAGVPWPLSVHRRIQGLPRPKFVDQFGGDLTEVLTRSDDILITGVTRNSLFTSHYAVLEEAVRRGCRLRVVLVDPTSEAVEVVAQRYYAERSSETVKTRIRQTERLLRALADAPGGAVDLRFTTHPLAFGAIAVDVGATDPDAGVLALEYFTYRAAHEPRFFLTAADGVAYRAFVEEAEQLWATGRSVTGDAT